MLVVEGPDGAGKTTLIKTLQEYLDLPVAPRVVSKDAEAMVDLQSWVDNQLDEGFQPMIYDRHRLISETIYGPILRRAQADGFNELKWLAPRMRRFYELEPVIIYCLPSLETVMSNVIGDINNRVVESKIEAIYAAYVARAALDYSFSPGLVKIWDYENSAKINNMPTWINKVREEIEFRRASKND